VTRLISSIRSVISELVGLIVDDYLVLGGCLAALGVGGLLVHWHSLPGAAVGFGLFGAIWLTLMGSVVRAARRVQPSSEQSYARVSSNQPVANRAGTVSAAAPE